MTRALLIVLSLAGWGDWAWSAASGDDYFHSLLCARPAAPARTVAGDEANTRLRTRFDPTYWSGELSKERLSASGNATELWRASQQLPRQRSIKINTGAGLVDFTWAELNTSQQEQLNTDPQGNFDGYGAARVKRLRGEACDGLDGCAALRQALPSLGDIVNSQPLVIAAPQRDSAALERHDGPPGAYAAFKARPRRTQVYVGANDGMLHGFDAASGEERLAIVPSALLPRLPALTAASYANGDRHRFFVDGALVAQDVFFADAWHTVMLVSLGAGGRGLLALDVSAPDQVRLLWEFDTRHDPQLGYLLGAPTIAHLHTGQWAALLGTGMDAPAGSAALLIVDIQTGSVIKRLPLPEPATELAMPLVADTNGDGNADYAYAGDNLGNLWRFDLYDTRAGHLNKAMQPVQAAAFRLSFGGRPLFSAPGKPASLLPPPITLAPAIVSHPLETGYLIVLGTGQNHLPADRDLHSLYGIWDRHTHGEDTQALAPVRFADLQQQQVTPLPNTHNGALALSHQPIEWQPNSPEGQGKLGWYIDLQAANADAASERLAAPPQRLGELLAFTTRIPSTLPCQADLLTRLYLIDPAVGGGVRHPTFDLNGDGLIDSQDASEGLVPAAISAPPSVQISVDPPTGRPCVLGAADCAPLSLGPRANGRQSWRVISDGTP
ncbi:MAG: PilC/PilY family type IV pilus protein [Pseudomonas sp.]